MKRVFEDEKKNIQNIFAHRIIFVFLFSFCLRVSIEQVREETFSSYRSETEPETSLAGSPRPETPAFPLTPRTPYGLNGNISPALPPKSPTSIR